MQKAFVKEGFPAQIGPIPFLGLALLSQTGMSFVQQGLVILGTFFAVAYQLNLTELGLVTTALSTGVMVSMVFVGVAVDRLGPRNVLFVGAALMAGACSLLFFARTFSVLLVVLFFVGTFLAIVPSTGTKAVFSAFANRPRGLVMGIRQTGVPLGAALAAWSLPRWAPHFGLHFVYEIFVMELLVTGWLFSSMIPRPAARAGTTVHVRLERRHWLRLIGPVCVAFLLVSGQYILLTYSISDLHREHGLSLALAGTILAFSQIGGGTGRILLGQVSDLAHGRRTPVIAFTALLGAITAFCVGALPKNAPIWLLFGIWALFGVGAAGWNALVLTWAGESVPSSHSGLAMSLIGSVVFLGSAVFPPLFGFTVDTTHHLFAGWWMLSGILTVAAVTALVAGRREKPAL